MPSGIILSSASQGATQEAVEKVLAAHGYEADKPAAEPTEIVEPKREDFESDEAFETAQEEHEAKLEEAEQQREEKEEQERQKREQSQGAKPSRRQRAVEKATKELRDELRKANERLAALETGKKPNEEKPPQAVELKAPKREEFKTDAEFEDAQFDYRYKLRRQKEAVEAQQKAADDRLKENFEGYKAQVAAFKEEHDDWDKVVNQSIAIHESVYLAIMEQENGAAVTYYLGKNPDFSRKLAEMSPLSAVIEIGRLADKLKSGSASKPGAGTERTTKPKPRQLPEPVTPVSTAATSTTTTSRDAAQKRDFRAFKAAQRAGR